MEGKKLLLALASKYKGEWGKIYTAIEKRENLDEKYVEKLAQEYEGRYITMLDNEYPEILRQSYKPPFVLFYEGNINILTDKNYKKLALSDSKKTTNNDKQVAKEILSNLPDNVALIIGGESEFTCDITKQHINPTIVVLAYSPEHYGYVEFKQQIIKNGGVIISEYPDSAFNELNNNNFIGRYRIMGALCDKVLICSSIKQKSGSLVLAYMALEQNKDIGVIPVSPLDKESANNMLIGEGAFPIYNNESLCFIFS